MAVSHTFRKYRFIVGVLAFACVLPWMAQGSSRFPRPKVPSSSITTTEAKVKWEKQTHVDHYQIKRYKKDCSLVREVYRAKKSKTHKILRDLKPGKTYCIRMRAFYTDGTHSKFSKHRKFTTDEEPIADDEDDETNDNVNEDDTVNDNTNEDVPADDPEPIAEQMRYGLNFIRVNNTDSEALEAATQPAALDADFTALGIEAFRQFTSADGLWSNVSTPEGGFDFTDSDNMLLSTTHIPIMTLFSYQLADGTTPADEILGDTTPETSMTAEQEEYLGAIVEQYKNTVTYWEIGNEMAHWELSRPGEFPIEAQALWLKSVAEVITEHDPDAQIVLPGLISITEDNVDDWLEPVIQTAGSEWFDVVNYHYYSSWLHYTADRAGLQALIDEYDLQDKPVWLTETGSSADATNTTRTNYPNSPTEQAADVFRRSLLAYAAGDAFVGWHTYIGNDVSDNDFRYYGIVNADLTKQPAYYTTQLLTSTVAQFRSIENEGGFVYRVVGNDETTRYVAWSATASSWTVPTGMTQMTSVVPNNDGTFTWTSVVPGQTISLSDIPVLLE